MPTGTGTFLAALNAAVHYTLLDDDQLGYRKRLKKSHQLVHDFPVLHFLVVRFRRAS